MKQKILIIDDETDFCMIMKSYFMKRGFDVITANTLRDGLSLLEEAQPNILFLDNNLPDGNGWDAMGKVVEIIPHIKTYLVSAHRSNSSFANQNENITIWEKPISLSMLKEVG